jgi:hypothetical protein
VLNLVHLEDTNAKEYGEFMHKQGQKIFDFGAYYVRVVSHSAEQMSTSAVPRAQAAHSAGRGASSWQGLHRRAVPG